MSFFSRQIHNRGMGTGAFDAFSTSQSVAAAVQGGAFRNPSPPVYSAASVVNPTFMRAMRNASRSSEFTALTSGQPVSDPIAGDALNPGPGAFEPLPAEEEPNYAMWAAGGIAALVIVGGLGYAIVKRKG